jgi:hypothetical protein
LFRQSRGLRTGLEEASYNQRGRYHPLQHILFRDWRFSAPELLMQNSVFLIDEGLRRGDD